MNAAQVKFLMDLAEQKGVKCRSTFSYCYELVFESGEVYDGRYYDCLKKLGYYGMVH